MKIVQKDGVEGGRMRIEKISLRSYKWNTTKSCCNYRESKNRVFDGEKEKLVP